MIAYKLTDQDMKTRDGFQWILGTWVEKPWASNLDWTGWIYCYTHPLLAVLQTPIHENFKNPRLFEAEVGPNLKNSFGLHVGSTEVKLTKELPLPKITIEQRIRFRIFCAKAAQEARRAIERAGAKAEWIAWVRKEAESAADNAARAAESAAEATVEAAARVSACVARADLNAGSSADIARIAHEAGTAEIKPIDFIALAEKAIGKE